MARMLRLGEVLLGIEGLAVARQLFSGSDEAVAARVAELREVLDELAAPARPGPDQPMAQLAVRVVELDTLAGYERRAAGYDEAPDPLLDLEEPVLRSHLAHLPVGRALDAGCGTGRVAGWLHEHGHAVAAVDLSPAMAAAARVRVPDADVRVADVRALPFADGEFDVTVCSMTLAHLDSLHAAVAELARVTRAGGTVLLSDVHPWAALLDVQAFFVDDEGTAFVRHRVHLHGEYLRAFAAAGLEVRACVEPEATPGEGPLLGLAAQLRPEAATAAYVGMPFVLVWELLRTT